MARMLYSVSMSLDGFIADAGGDMSWLTDYLGPNPTIDALVDDIGALLVGRRSFGGDDPYADTPQEGEAFGGGWSGPHPGGTTVKLERVRLVEEPQATVVWLRVVG